MYCLLCYAHLVIFTIAIRHFTFTHSWLDKNYGPSSLENTHFRSISKCKTTPRIMHSTVELKWQTYDLCLLNFVCGVALQPGATFELNIELLQVSSSWRLSLSWFLWRTWSFKFRICTLWGYRLRRFFSHCRLGRFFLFHKMIVLYYTCLLSCNQKYSSFFSPGCNLRVISVYIWITFCILWNTEALFLTFDCIYLLPQKKVIFKDLRMISIWRTKLKWKDCSKPITFELPWCLMVSNIVPMMKKKSSMHIFYRFKSCHLKMNTQCE